MLVQVCLFYHRRSMSIQRVKRAMREGRAEEVFVKERLYQHVFELNSGHRAVVSTFGICLVVCLLLITMATLLAGMILPCFDFTVRGLVGMFMDIDEKKSQKQYSIWDLFVAITVQAATAKEHVGYFYLSISSIFSAMLIPILQILGLRYVIRVLFFYDELLIQAFCLSWMWCAPLSLEGQRRVFLMNELLGMKS